MSVHFVVNAIVVDEFWISINVNDIQFYLLLSIFHHCAVTVVCLQKINNLLNTFKGLIISPKPNFISESKYEIKRKKILYHLTIHYMKYVLD